MRRLAERYPANAPGRSGHTVVVRPLGLSVGLALTALAVASCGGTATTAGTTTTATTEPPTAATDPVPVGWRTYTYGAAELAVPPTWVVEHGTNCPDGQAAGTLLLGIPSTAQQCPMVPASPTYVVMSTTRSTSASGQPSVVNGVDVYPGFGSPSSIEWSVPELGVQLYGNGPGVDAVLHTLRRAPSGSAPPPVSP